VVGDLHGSVGNQAIQHLHETGDLQAKLDVSHPADPAEREADRVADAVMQVDESGPPVDVSRKSRRTDAAGTASTVDGRVEGDIRSLQGGGRPLQESTRSFFESRFGEDFSGVRVHTGPAADEAARSIDAKAFTLGQTIAFASGAYQPQTSEGKQLLAHELVHVVQQGATGLGAEGLADGSVQTTIVHRTLPADLPNPGAQPTNLTDAQVQDAIEYNKKKVRYDVEVERLRDMLGLSPQPATMDEAFVHALVRFQAQADLTEDGKLGPVTASRLARQFEAEAAFLGDEGTAARKEELRLNAQSLTISVTQPHVEHSSTGAVEYAVQWDVPDSTANGWIVQHVEWSAEKEDIAGNDQPTNNSDGLEFWEAWEVRSGDVYIGGTNQRHSADTFRTVDEGADTKGTVKIDGHVTFMPGYDLQKPPWGHTIRAAGALPTRRDEPDGWSDGYARHHYLEVEWDDCKNPSEQDVETKP
jgi:hypothetical protein